MSAVLTTFFLVLGAAFILVASVGLLRMPDVYLRISACTKATTLGVGSILVGTAIHFDSVGTTSRAVAIALFIGLTAPIAGHMIGRAAYLARTPMWSGTIIDDLRGRYDPRRPVLHSPPDDGGEPAKDL